MRLMRKAWVGTAASEVFESRVGWFAGQSTFILRFDEEIGRNRISTLSLSLEETVEAGHGATCTYGHFYRCVIT